MSVWSLNTYFHEVGDPFAVYECVVDYSVSGQRLNPLNLAQRIEFCVDGNSDDLENRSIALYNEQELRFFLKANKALIESGILVPYKGKPKDVNTINAIDDDEVMRIASLRSAEEIEKELEKFTDQLPIKRILDAAEYLGRSNRILNVIRKKLETYDSSTEK